MNNLSIRQIARETGVSAMTVSRVVSGSGAVKAETRDRVLGFIRHFSSTDNVTVKAVRRQKNVLLVCNGKIQEEDDFLFRSRIYFSLLEELKSEGFSAVMTDAKGTEDDLRLELSRNAVAVLLPGCNSATVELLLRLHPGIRLITVCFMYPGVCGVGPDDFAGGELAADYLAAKGYRRVGVLASLESECIIRRNQSFIQRMKRQSSGCVVDTLYYHDIPFDDAPQYRVLSEYMMSHDGKLPEALFCPAGYATMVAYKFMIRHGFRVGKDCEILGYDNFPFYDHIDTPLSRIVFEPNDLGLTAAKMAMQLILDPDFTCPLNTLIPVMLIDRH